MAPHYWRAILTSYRERSALVFPSENTFAAGLQLLHGDQELEGMPYALVGGHTMIVPTEAVELLVRKKLSFHVQRVVPASEAPPEEVAKMRRAMRGN